MKSEKVEHICRFCGETFECKSSGAHHDLVCSSEHCIMLHLRAAREEVKKQKQAIEDEMRERGETGQLWTNGQCAAWDDYVRAEEELDRLRAIYKT